MNSRKMTAAALLLAAVMLAGCAQRGTQIVVEDGGGRAEAGVGDYGNGEKNESAAAQENPVVDPAPGTVPDHEPKETAADNTAADPLPGADLETKASLPDRTLPDGETVGPPVLPSSGSGLSFGARILKAEDLDPHVTYVNWSEAGGAAFQGWAMEYTEGRIVSVEDRRTLDAFLADMGRYFSLGAEGKGFRGLADAWDEAFFGDKVLLVIYLPSGSGSNRYVLKSAEIWESKLSLQIDCQIPEIGTCDMAGWFLSIELPRKVWGKVNCVGMDVNAVRMGS